jgi:Flp pilus assembly pilin Flp
MLNFVVFAQRKLADLKDDCKGVTAMEYGIIAAFTVAAIGGTIALIGSDLTSIWGSIQSKLDAAKSAA